MTDPSLAPTGLARRGRRLSDQETEQRMLQAAVAMVNRTGLTVSLDHISLEDVIRDADVSRSAVYRHWPFKDMFLSDLLRELARASTPVAVTSEKTSMEVVRSVVLEHPDWLETPEYLQQFALELFRLGALHDFETIYGSTEWRTYIALHATFLSLPESNLRDELQTILAESQRGFTDRLAETYQLLAGLLGYRLRPETAVTFETLAVILHATMRGLVIMALSTPATATHRAMAMPFGAEQETSWSLPGIAVAGLAFAFLEPDPAIEWNDERLEDLRRVLRAVGGNGD